MSELDYRDGPLSQYVILHKWQPPASGTAPAPCWQLENGAFVAELPASPARPMCSNACPWCRPREVERSRLALEGRAWLGSQDDYCTHPVHGQSVCHRRSLCWPVYGSLWRRARGVEVTNESR